MHEAGDPTENQSRFSTDDVETHCAQNQADANGENRFVEIVAAQSDEGGKGQQHEGELFRRAEYEGHVGKRRRKESE